MGAPRGPRSGSVVQGDKQGMGALKESLAEARLGENSIRTVRSCQSRIRTSAGPSAERSIGSIADWTINMTPSPPDGAPNALLVLIDYEGSGIPSTFGGPVATPTMTRVAEQGLTYNRFHLTAICSPTRAAMLTGRITTPSGSGRSATASSVPRLLREPAEGLRPLRPRPSGQWLFDRRIRQAALTPDHVQGAAGPFDRWPNSWGFDHFWGILGGEAGQYDPVITQDNRPSASRRASIRSSTTGRTISRIRRSGGCIECGRRTGEAVVHLLLDGVRARAHHVAVEWSEKYRGTFDRGWDALREETLNDSNSWVSSRRMRSSRRDRTRCPWDSLSDDEKKLYARQMEVYAGFQENTDWNIGRLLDSIEAMGDLDNTLVIYVFGDNGASMEGLVTGTFNELTMQNAIVLTSEQQPR